VASGAKPNKTAVQVILFLHEMCKLMAETAGNLRKKTKG